MRIVRRLAWQPHSRSHIFSSRITTWREEWFYESTISRWNVYKEWFTIGGSGRDAGRRWGRTLSGYSILDPWAATHYLCAIYTRCRFSLCTFMYFLCARSHRRNRKTPYECLTFVVWSTFHHCHEKCCRDDKDMLTEMYYNVQLTT